MNGNGSAAGYRSATPNAKYVGGYENKTEASNLKSNTNNHIMQGSLLGRRAFTSRIAE